MTTPAARVEHVAGLFRKRFGSAPELWARAPGRVDLMGSHTDYNLGYVLTLPISRETWMAARPAQDRTVRIYSANLEADDCFSLDSIDKQPPADWSNYVRGVASVLQQEGFTLRGFDAVIHSTLPIASGLSSSAALECATAIVFRELGGWPIEPERMARLCQKAENQFVGVNCGILDQYSSCLGQAGYALLLDCRDLSTRAAPLARGLRVVICDTRAERKLSGGEYSARRAQCEQGAARMGVAALREVDLARLESHAHLLSAEVLRRCRFIIMENERVLRMAEAVTAGDRPAIARLCADSFSGARDLYEICAPPMAAMMEAMLAAPGVVGARQAGAGFGGCMVALVEAERTEQFGEAAAKAYRDATETTPEIFTVEAAAGAGPFLPERMLI